jgi:hypothetical protein
MCTHDIDKFYRLEKNYPVYFLFCFSGPFRSVSIKMRAEQLRNYNEETLFAS